VATIAKTTTKDDNNKKTNKKLSDKKRQTQNHMTIENYNNNIIQNHKK